MLAQSFSARRLDSGIWPVRCGSFSTQLAACHHGMVIVGLPYAFQGQTRMDEITGGSPYGTSTIAGGKGERMASENEIAAARFQGRHVARIAKKLAD